MQPNRFLNLRATQVRIHQIGGIMILPPCEDCFGIFGFKFYDTEPSIPQEDIQGVLIWQKPEPHVGLNFKHSHQYKNGDIIILPETSAKTLSKLDKPTLSLVFQGKNVRIMILGPDSITGDTMFLEEVKWKE